jgi:hypothetical protein
LAVLHQRQAGYGATPAYGAFYAAPSANLQSPTQGMAYPAASYPPAAPKKEPMLFSCIEPEDEPKPNKAAVIVLSVLLCVAGFVLMILTGAIFASSPEEAGEMVGRPVGQTLFLAVLIFLVWRVFLKKSMRVGFLIISIIFSATVAFNFLGALGEAKANRSLFREYRSFYDKFNSGVPLPTRTFSERSYGKYAPMLQASYDYLAVFQNDRMAKEKELKELHLDNLLTTESMQDANHIDDARRRLAAIIEVINRYEALQGQRAEEVVSKIQNLALPARSKKGFLSSFSSSFGESFENTKELYEAQRMVLQKMDVMLYFMRGKQGKYHFLGEQLKFSSERDHNVYRQHYSELEALGESEIEIREAIARQQQKNYDATRQALK